MASIRRDEEQSSLGSFPKELESRGDVTLLRPSRKPTARDLGLSAGGALLAHVLVAAAVLLVPLSQPPRDIEGAFLTVSLVTGGGTRSGSCNTDRPEGADQGMELEEPSPGGKQVEELPATDTSKAVKRVEQPVSAEKKSKETLARPEMKSKQNPAASRVDSAADVASSPSSSPESADEMARTESNGGQGHGPGQGGGARPGGGPSGSRLGGSWLGTGSHPGEFNADAVDQAPQVLQKNEPVYPYRARQLGICGKVVVRFLVGPDGRVSRSSILEAHPEGFFERSALEAIRQWRFKPGIYRGEAVATWVVLPIQFRLTG